MATADPGYNPTTLSGGGSASLTETSGPTTLTLGSIADGLAVKRQGTELVGYAPGAATLTETSGPTTMTLGAIADGQTWKRVGTTVVGYTPSSSGAPSTATYIVQTADSGLSAEQALGALATGILKSTTTTGVLSIAAANTDYAIPTRDLIAGAGLTGGGTLAADRAFNVVAHADGSMVVNANDIQVGVLATDAQHGVRGGGTQHANVIAAGAAGFMTGTDKTKLDGIAAGAGVIYGPRETYLDLAISRAGLTPGNLTIYWDDFLDASQTSAAPSGWVSVSTGTGSVGASTVGTLGGGHCPVSSGASANGSGRAITRSNLTKPNLMTQRWYVAFKFRLTTTVDATTVLAVGLVSTGETTTTAAGFFGAANATNYGVLSGNTIFSGGNFLDLGVAVDQNVDHIIEFYGKGSTTIYGRIDGGSEVSGTLASATASEMGIIGAMNGAAAVARSILPDWLLIVAPRS